MKEKPSIWIEHLMPEFEQIQNELFNLGSQLACESEEMRPHLPQINSEMIQRLETQIDKMQTNLPPLKDFILPGGTMIAAQIHICRTVSRRAERELLTMYGTETPPTNYLQYLNRLSDYFFVAARFVNFNLNAPDVIWRKD
jgi:cob(I)alamin adenosyltransferase